MKLKVFIDKDDHVPYALDEQGKIPMQLFTRWYGFSLTYPDCEVYKEDLVQVGFHPPGTRDPI